MRSTDSTKPATSARVLPLTTGLKLDPAVVAYNRAAAEAQTRDGSMERSFQNDVERAKANLAKARAQNP